MIQTFTPPRGEGASGRSRSTAGTGAPEGGPAGRPGTPSSGARSPIGLQTRIDKVLDVTIGRETERLERRLLFLATVGSAAPFIGLFGTVWGIMTSFQAIAASKNTALAVVAPGIAEALLATALGLLAAIPAVIAYNKLSNEAAKIGQRLDGFGDEFSAILSRAEPADACIGPEISRAICRMEISSISAASTIR